MTTEFAPTLFGSGAPEPDPSFAGARRIALDERSWVDLVPGWLAGADTWFTEIVDAAPWGHRRRRMYERELWEPRLTCGWPVAEAPDPSARIAAVLGERYGVHFDRVWANYYRHGDDSVAWHGDRVRFTHDAPVVAIVSLGSARRFGLRPLPGRAGDEAQRSSTQERRETRRLTVAGGDLLVMGGRCQHEWQHTVPKAAGGGPRVSVTFRHDDPGPRP